MNNDFIISKCLKCKKATHIVNPITGTITHFCNNKNIVNLERCPEEKYISIYDFIKNASIDNVIELLYDINRNEYLFCKYCNKCSESNCRAAIKKYLESEVLIKNE